MASIDRSIVRSIGILRRVGMHQDVRTYIQRRQKDVSNPHISFIRKLTTLQLAIFTIYYFYFVISCTPVLTHNYFQPSVSCSCICESFVWHFVASRKSLSLSKNLQCTEKDRRRTYDMCWAVDSSPRLSKNYNYNLLLVFVC